MGQVYSPGSIQVAIPLKYSPLSLITHAFTVNLSHVFIFFFVKQSMPNTFYVRREWVGRREVAKYDFHLVL